MSLRSAALWPIRQLRGALANLGAVLSETATDPDDYVPPSIWGLWLWIRAKVPESLGFGSPEDQITGSLAMILLSIVTSFITLGATLVLVFFFFGTLLVGLLRLVPVINAIWPLGD